MASVAQPLDSAPARQSAAPEGFGLASFPPAIRENPYQRLLYGALAEHGCEVAPDGRLKLAWLRRARGRVSVLHFHWPQGYYRHERGPEPLRPALSWVRLGVFTGRLLAARALGFRIAWTVHQVYPHEVESPRLERTAVRVLGRAASLLIAHDEATAAQVRSELGCTAVVVPHGPFTGVYEEGRDRAAVRAELGIADDAVVFLSFGHLRGYKNVGTLVDAFARCTASDAVLLVAGLPLDEEAESLVREAAERDGRIRTLLGFVPDDRVAELHGAADAAVLARGDGGTSGALVLALSLGLPVIAASLPAYRQLTRDGELGWHFAPNDADDLAAELDRVAADPAAVAEKAAAVRAHAATGWDEVGERTAALMREALR